jgi:hypothetical protein
MRTQLLKGLFVLVASVVFTLRPGVSQEVSTPQTCAAANECNGVLPMMYMICTDGVSRCAHWTCTKGACVAETCMPKRSGG